MQEVELLQLLHFREGHKIIPDLEKCEMHKTKLSMWVKDLIKWSKHRHVRDAPK